MISIQKENELGKYILRDVSLNNKQVYTFNYPCETDYSECFPYEINFSPGIYFLECWGASGSSITDEETTVEGGTGGYSSGIFILQRRKTVYLYIGGSSNLTIIDPEVYTTPLKNSFNGGEKGGKNSNDGIGGGATDFRTKGGDWPSNLESRFLVAGGGGSARTRLYNLDYVNYKGGDAGGTEGTPGEGEICDSSYGTNSDSAFPTCSNATLNHEEGGFGYGASGLWAGGGGGYYGGGLVYNGAGGGGSGYYGFLLSYGNYNATTTKSSHRGFGMAKITILANEDLKLIQLNSLKSKICNNINDISLFLLISIK